LEEFAMPCNGRDELIGAYLDAELDSSGVRELQRHLTDCPVCSARMDQVQRLRNELQAHLPRYQAPESLLISLRAELEHEANRIDAGESRARPWLALAAGLFLGVVGMGLLAHRDRTAATGDALTEQVVASHVRSLLANHLTDVASSDQHTVKPWFIGKLDFAPPVFDLADQGFPLVGGRLDYLDDHAVAVMVYRRRAHVINLLVWPVAAGGAAPTVATRRGYHLIHGFAGGMTYWLVSDVAAGDLALLEGLFRARLGD
jgi:anti-sigma factor RsiW